MSQFTSGLQVRSPVKTDSFWSQSLDQTDLIIMPEKQEKAKNWVWLFAKFDRYFHTTYKCCLSGTLTNVAEMWGIMLTIRPRSNLTCLYWSADAGSGLNRFSVTTSWSVSYWADLYFAASTFEKTFLIFWFWWIT